MGYGKAWGVSCASRPIHDMLSFMETEVTAEAKEAPELAEMYSAGMHFGYTKTRRHPKMRPFIFGTRSNVEVFDLSKVLGELTRTLDAVRALGAEGKTILFVATKACAKESLRKTATALNMPYVTERWLGGTMTNFKMISERIQYWQDLIRRESAGELKKYTKHEQLKLQEKTAKLQYMYGGLENMKKLPHALFVVDLGEERLAVAEAIQRDISIFALSSSDTNPALADYIIPANDNSRRSIEYVLAKVESAYQEGKRVQEATALASVVAPTTSPEA